MSQPVGAPSSLGGEMNFVMQRVEYDRHKERAYVEFRGRDDDGGDAYRRPLLVVDRHGMMSCKKPIQAPSEWLSSYKLGKLPSPRRKASGGFTDPQSVGGT